MRNLCWLSLLLMAVPVWAAEPDRAGQYVIFMSDKGVVVLKFEITIGGTDPSQFFSRYVDQLMTSLDVNQDGTITTDEANGNYLTAREAVQAGLVPAGETPPANINPDNSPADGKISRQEFLSYFKRIGFHPFLMTYQPSMIVTSPTGRVKIRQSTNNSETSLFTRLDTNADGKLSKQELADALKTLRKFDFDDDDAISAAELNPVTTTIGGQVRTVGQAMAASPFIGLGLDESLPKQIRRLLQKYDREESSDKSNAKSKNQKLSGSELGFSPEMIALYDGDSDEQLDFDELRQLVSSPSPTVSIAVNLDIAGPLNSTAMQPEYQELLRTTADGAANINLGTTLLSITRGAVNDTITAESLLKPQFMNADRDANGYLEKSEADQAYLFGATFENLDRDKNGKVYLDEAVAYFKIHFDAARSRTVLTIAEQGRTLFEILDADRDRRLSYRELQIAADKLTAWDQDQDGQLSETEIPLQYRLMISRGNIPALMGNPGSAADTNQPRVAVDKLSGVVWFRRMDKNRDGEISKREFLGPLEQFEKLDTNHDGFIDMVEASQAAAE